jgi:uncharacterized protein
VCRGPFSAVWLLVVLAAGGSACRAQAVAPPSARPTVRVVSDRISQAVLEQYQAYLPDVSLKLIDTAPGTLATVSAVQSGAADVGFVLADVAYFANTRSTGDLPAEQLRALVALPTAAVHLLVRPGLSDSALDGRPALRVRTNAAFSSQKLLAQLMFSEYNLGPDSVHEQPLPNDSIAEALISRQIDAAFITDFFPSLAVSGATGKGARLLPIDGAASARLRERYPFVRTLTIPADTYVMQHAPVRTVGVDRLLVCRTDLDAQLAHSLTRGFVEAIPHLQSVIRSSRLVELQQASTASIPLHNGAAQYFRERELTP